MNPQCWSEIDNLISQIDIALDDLGGLKGTDTLYLSGGLQLTTDLSSTDCASCLDRSGLRYTSRIMFWVCKQVSEIVKILGMYMSRSQIHIQVLGTRPGPKYPSRSKVNVAHYILGG